MDRPLSSLPGFDPRAHAITEVDVAIEMVARGAAVSVRLCNLQAAEESAFDAAARAQAADVAFSLKRDGPTSMTMIVGPLLKTPLEAVE